MVDGRRARALLDTGCSKSLVGSWITKPVCCSSGAIVSVDGRETSSIGSAVVRVETEGFKEMVDVDVMKSLAGQLDVILGMDFIGAIGGIRIKSGCVQYLRRDEDSCRDVGASAVTRGGGSDLAVSDVDFEAKFDGGA